MLPRISDLPLLRLSVLLAAACLAACAVQPDAVLVSAPGDTKQYLFTQGWLFNLEDTAGADATAFDDAAWRELDLPHDWSIEQPFDQNGPAAPASSPAALPGIANTSPSHPTAGQNPPPPLRRHLQKLHRLPQRP